MATFVNDLRLTELATGEGSGTWGTTTNTNLELIAESFSFGTEAITTNADTHTTTIADGSTDPGRSLFLKYTGTLDSACTITIGPNTVSKLWFIENATSGSQNIIISQGSGADITIPNGQTKAIYSDGAGSGAAMVDAFQDLSIPDLFVDDDLTVGDDLILSSDSAIIKFGADADTTLTHTDGSGLTLNSTNKIMFNDASQFIQGSSATVLSLGATDEIDLTATAIDVNGTIDVSGNATLGGTLGVTGAVTANAGISIDNITIDGTEIDLSSGDLTIDVAGDIILDADGANIIFKDGGTSFAELDKDGNNFRIKNPIADGDIKIQGVDGSSTISALDFDMSAAGKAVFNAGIVVNESGGDNNTRFEGENLTSLIDIDASTDRIGLGTGSPGFPIHASFTDSIVAVIDSDNDSGTFLFIRNSDATTGRTANLGFAPANSIEGARIVAEAIEDFSTSANRTADIAFQVRHNGTMAERWRIHSDGAFVSQAQTPVAIGGTPADANFTELGSGYINLARDDTADADQVLFAKNGAIHSKITTSASGLTVGSIGNLNTFINAGTSGSNILDLQSGGTTRARVENSGMTVNPAGASNIDFICESQHLTHLLFCDAGNSKVGIGLSSPDNRLHVVDSTSGSVAPVVIGNEDNTAATTQKVKLGFGLARDSGTVKNDAGEIEVGKDNQWDANDNNVDAYMAFATYKNNARTEHMRVNSSGILAIGDSTPEDGAFEATRCLFLQGNESVQIIKNTSASDSAQRVAIGFLNSSGTAVGYISNNSSSTVFSTSSDYRLKENVTYNWDALTRLKELKPVRFNWIVDDTNTLVDGFLAHEAQAVVPEAVQGTHNQTRDLTNVVLNEFGNVIAKEVTENEWKSGKEGENPVYAANTTWKAEHTQDVYQGIDQSKLVPLLVKAIQEQQDLIETLQTKVAALEGGS